MLSSLSEKLDFQACFIVRERELRKSKIGWYFTLAGTVAFHQVDAPGFLPLGLETADLLLLLIQILTVEG